MKLKALINVEFEMEEGQAANAASAALARGLSLFRLAIEQGSGIGPASVKRNSIKLEIGRKDLTE